MIHIGQEIRQRLDAKGHTVVWMSHQLSCSRTNIYKIFEKEHLDTALLMRISHILGFNFFALYAREYEQTAGMRD